MLMRNLLIPAAITLTIVSMLAGCAGSVDFERGGEKFHVELNLHPHTDENPIAAIVPHEEL